ncbi:MAG: hypothetical protein ACFFD4_15860 [Candidatus Odinarchaeota archaeon]
MMTSSSSNLISSVVNLMTEREQAKKAKRERNAYHGTDPDFTIDSADYYIKTHLYILQTAGKSTPGGVTVY